MLFPHSESLTLTIEVLEDTENELYPASALCFDTLGNLHAHVKLDIVLSNGQYKFHLLCNTYVDGWKD